MSVLTIATSKGFNPEEEKQYESYYMILVLIQRWLKKNYDIDITVMIRFASDYGVMVHKNRCISNGFKEIIVSPTPENYRILPEVALLEGIRAALKLI